MANLWLWFPNAEERRQYVVDLLGLKSRNKEIMELQEQCLSDLEEGKTRSPWYCVEGKFYMNITRGYEDQTLPFEDLPVWEKGFRRIYTQKSYYFRPGHWLVLKLRDNAAARKIRKHVSETFPKERQGTNVPLPLESQMFLNLRQVKGWLNTYKTWRDMGKTKPFFLELAYKGAEEILLACPWLFKGDDIYLWEDMAMHWQEYGKLNKAARCYRNQARLQPNKTDAWINLSSMYFDCCMFISSAEACLEGLKVDPDDPYLGDNLSTILSDKLVAAKVLCHLNKDGNVKKYARLLEKVNPRL